MEPADTGLPVSRSLLRIAGASLAEHQFGLALALECRKIVCLVRENLGELAALRESAEKAGLQFHVAASRADLAGHVTAADELVVMVEGLFAEPAGAAPLLATGGAQILSLPDLEGVALGFERIDATRASAGLMRLPGHLVERLHDLPDDYDIPSALTRIALQAGIPVREVPEAARGGVGWRLVRSEVEAHDVEDAWLRDRFGANPLFSPGQALARFAVVAFGSSLLYAGNASNVASAAVLVVLALAGGFAFFPVGSVALLLCGVAWLLVEASRMLRDAERQPLAETAPAIPRADALAVVIDAALVLIMLYLTAPIPARLWANWLSPPVMLVLLLQFVPRLLSPRGGALVADRLLLSVLLAAGSLFGLLAPVVALLGLGLAALAIVLARAPADG